MLGWAVHNDTVQAAGIPSGRKHIDTGLICTMISTMKIRLALLAISFLAASLAAQTAGIPAGGFAGTWSANFAKSHFPGPPPKVDMCMIDPDGTVTVHEVNSEGKDIQWHYTPIQGKPVSVVGRDNVTVTVRKVNDHLNQHIWNIEGRPAQSKSVLSADGKTTTFTIDGTGKDGKLFHEVVVYDKQ